MPTSFPFTRRLQIADIVDPAKAVGAHLAAKLQLFGTDERTLTDELCDMLCIWLGMQSSGLSSAAISRLAFALTVSKTTAIKERKIGADLDLVVTSPLGHKRCLIQAKVLDPKTGALRCSSSAGLRQLQRQLLAAKREAGDLAFLMVYVPGALLDGGAYGFSTYEQREISRPAGTQPAFFGATLIPVSAILDNSDAWLDPGLKVPQSAPGVFRGGIALWQMLLELLLCRRSDWTKGSPPSVSEKPRAVHRLDIGVSEISQDEWREVQATAGRLLDADSSSGPGQSDA